MITLPFDTPTANVLRFIIVEYIILKLFGIAIEALTHVSASRRASNGEVVTFHEGWLAFFLVPYRIHERSLVRKLLPWLLVLICNAFLLSIEFGFQSTSREVFPILDTTQELPTDVLGASKALDGVPDVNWITRANLLTEKCVNRRGPEVYISEGYIDKVFLDDDDYERSVQDKNKVICLVDSRVHTPPKEVNFNLSHAGFEDTKQPFRYATADLMVGKVATNLFSFLGGDIDLDVSGKLDLSLQSPGDGDYVFDVFGSCTGFENGATTDTESAGPEFDATVYCYLSDRGSNRFIVTAFLDGNSDVSVLGDAEEGQTMRLVESSTVFRAEFLPDFPGRDGDHLAAIKSLVVTFRPRGGAVSDPITLLLLYPAITRSFAIATVLGATSLRRTAVSVDADWTQKRTTERAQVTSWALAMLCLMVIVPLLVYVVFYFMARRVKKWNIPVKFNALAQMAKEENCGVCPEEGRVLKQSITCGLGDNGGGLRYRPMQATKEMVREEGVFEELEKA